MLVYVGSDHNGFDFKKDILDFLKSLGYDSIDCGDKLLDPNDDFPKFASVVSREVLTNSGSFGVLICGSGQGMVMAANRHKGIRASLCWNTEEAYDSRNDDDSNILCLSSKYLELEQIKQIITVFFKTPYANVARFTRRIQELDNLT